MAVRESVFGRQGWYPDDANRCRQAIAAFEKTFAPLPKNAETLHGGIVPHAGWRFSGAIAAGVFHRLARQEPDTVVIYGMHLGPRSDTYMMTEGSWTTPVGVLAIDGDLAAAVAREFEVLIETADRFQPDNTIEVQLPLIRHFFPKARLVPIGVPPNHDSLALAARVAALALAQGKRILAIGSTDLTHYGPNYGFVPHGVGDEALEWVTEVHDPTVIHKMTRLDADGVLAEALAHHNACCPGAAAAAIKTAVGLGAKKGEVTKYGTSHDVSPGASFVGYAGIVF
jgi:AmmeMemoRadiSam system protein B